MAPVQVKKQPTFSWIGKIGGKLLVLALVTYFVSKILIAAGKLEHEKIGISQTSKYEESLLFPSISICFRLMRGVYKYNGTEVESGFNITKQV